MPQHKLQTSGAHTLAGIDSGGVVARGEWERRRIGSMVGHKHHQEHIHHEAMEGLANEFSEAKSHPHPPKEHAKIFEMGAHHAAEKSTAVGGEARTACEIKLLLNDRCETGVHVAPSLVGYRIPNSRVKWLQLSRKKRNVAPEYYDVDVDLECGKRISAGCNRGVFYNLHSEVLGFHIQMGHREHQPAHSTVASQPMSYQRGCERNKIEDARNRKPHIGKAVRPKSIDLYQEIVSCQGLILNAVDIIHTV
jgi:hypothetical protein